MKINSSLATKAGIGYTIGNLLVKGINFLSLPLFRRLLSTDEFGLYSVFISYEAILSLIIGFALHSSIRSANIEFNKKIDHYTSSVTIIYIFLASVFLFITYLYQDLFSNLIGLPYLFIILLIIYSFAGAILALYNDRLSLEYSYKKYLLISFINSVLNISLSLVFILFIFNHDRALGRIAGSSIAIFFVSFLLLLSLYKKAIPSINFEYWKFGLKYSLPIVPHGISQVLLGQFDRIMIRTLVSNSAAGIYSLAANINLILVIITTSIATAWGNWFYNEIEKHNILLIQYRAIQLLSLFSYISVFTIMVSPELVLLLGGPKYALAKYVAIPMIIDAYVLFIYNIIIQAEYYKKKTFWIMIGTIIAAAINIYTNIKYIPQYGFFAAAYTTLFSYICYILLHLFISYKLLNKFIIPVKWLILLTSFVSVSGYISYVFIDVILFRIVSIILLAFCMLIFLYHENILKISINHRR